jgi:hypothetical protein
VILKLGRIANGHIVETEFLCSQETAIAIMWAEQELAHTVQLFDHGGVDAIAMMGPPAVVARDQLASSRWLTRGLERIPRQQAGLAQPAQVRTAHGRRCADTAAGGEAVTSMRLKSAECPHCKTVDVHHPLTTTRIDLGSYRPCIVATIKVYTCRSCGMTFEIAQRSSLGGITKKSTERRKGSRT